MYKRNTTETWNVNLEDFEDKNSVWGRHILGNPKINEDPSIGLSLIYFSNLPNKLQLGLLNEESGLPENSKISTHFLNKSQQIIDVIVRSKTILKKIPFNCLYENTRKELTKSVYLAVQKSLENDFSERTISNSFQTNSVQIEEDLSSWTMSIDMLGTASQTAIQNSNIDKYSVEYNEEGQFLDWDGRRMDIYYDDNMIVPAFKTGETLGETDINSDSEDSLLTRKQIELENFNEIIEAFEIDDMNINYNSYIKANEKRISPKEGDIVILEYKGSDPDFYVDGQGVTEYYTLKNNNYIKTTFNIKLWSLKDEEAIIGNFKIELENYLIIKEDEVPFDGELKSFFQKFDIVNKWPNFPQFYLNGEKLIYGIHYEFYEEDKYTNVGLKFKYAGVKTKNYCFDIAIQIPFKSSEIDDYEDLVSKEELREEVDKLNNKIDSKPNFITWKAHIPMDEVLTWNGVGNKWQTRILRYLTNLYELNTSNILSMTTKVRSPEYDKECSLAAAKFGSGNSYNMEFKRTINGDVNNSALYVKLKADGSVNHNVKTPDSYAFLTVEYLVDFSDSTSEENWYSQTRSENDPDFITFKRNNIDAEINLVKEQIASPETEQVEKDYLNKRLSELNSERGKYEYE